MTLTYRIAHNRNMCSTSMTAVAFDVLYNRDHVLSIFFDPPTNQLICLVNREKNCKEFSNSHREIFNSLVMIFHSEKSLFRTSPSKHGYT